MHALHIGITACFVHADAPKWEPRYGVPRVLHGRSVRFGLRWLDLSGAYNHNIAAIEADCAYMWQVCGHAHGVSTHAERPCATSRLQVYPSFCYSAAQVSISHQNFIGVPFFRYPILSLCYMQATS